MKPKNSPYRQRGGYINSPNRSSKPNFNSFDSKKKYILKTVNSSNAIQKSASFNRMVQKFMQTKVGSLVFGVITNSIYFEHNNLQKQTLFKIE